MPEQPNFFEYLKHAYFWKCAEDTAERAQESRNETSDSQTERTEEAAQSAGKERKQWA